MLTKLLPLLSLALAFALVNGGAVQFCSSSSPSGDCPAGVAENDPTNTADRGDYYLLSVSWTPTFCCYGPGKKNKNCDECALMHQQNYPFYLHGLWPQCANPKSGTFLGQCCVPNKWDGIKNDPVMYKACKDNVVDVIGWCDSPVLGGGEWPRHGTCSGLDAPTYFNAANEAFNFVKTNFLTTLAEKIFNAPRVRKNKGVQSYIQLEELLSVFPEGSIREVNIPGRTGVVDELRICFQKKAGSSEPDISLAGMHCGDQELLTTTQDLFFAVPCVLGYNDQCDVTPPPGPPTPTTPAPPTPNGGTTTPSPAMPPPQVCQVGKQGPACKTDQDCCKYGSCKRCSRNSKRCTAEQGYDACRDDL